VFHFLRAAFCFVAIVMPLLFLFAGPGALPGTSDLRDLYVSLVTLVGERHGRVLFCSVWLAVDGALVWRLLLCKEEDDSVPPIDYLGD
jgi:hypothetical protein